MRICASLGSVGDVRSGELEKADVIEIRTDIFDTVPDGILRRGQTGLITFKGDIIPSMIPDGWLTDIGEADRSAAGGRSAGVMTSYHDFTGTPSVEEVLRILSSMNGDIVKGAFTVNSVSDIMTLFDASRLIGRKHVIIGMSELGRITRVRNETMGNEFAFSYVSRETAPGQMKVSEIRRLGDDCMVTGIVGCGIDYTRTPGMQNAAFAHSGINGISLRFDTASADRVGELMVNFNIRGMNVTKPYKTDIIDQLDTLDGISEDVGAVNTVVNDNGELTGHNTDVHGIDAALKMNSVHVNGMRALVLGSGGAARSCAYFLSENGCDVTVTGRNADTMRSISRDLAVTARERESVAVKSYDLIVNCIPLNKSSDRLDYPVRIDQIAREQVVFDMVYGDTHLNDVAAERGCKIVRGEEMLVHQGLRAFELFTGAKIPYEVMRDAV